MTDLTSDPLFSIDFYTKTELPLRLAFFWMSSNVCSIIASFIAFGVLHLRGTLGKAGWRWLFLVEYVISPATLINNLISTYAEAFSHSSLASQHSL